MASMGKVHARWALTVSQPTRVSPGVHQEMRRYSPVWWGESGEGPYSGWKCGIIQEGFLEEAAFTGVEGVRESIRRDLE